MSNAPIDRWLLPRGFIPAVPTMNNPGGQNLLGNSKPALFRGDRDSFSFFYSDKLPGDDVLGGMRKGLFVWNSEVGARAFGWSTFYFREVCGNFLVWDVRDVKERRAIHKGEQLRSTWWRDFRPPGVQIPKFTRFPALWVWSYQAPESFTIIMSDYIQASICNGIREEQALIRGWWHEERKAEGMLVWEFHLNGKYADAILFCDEENPGREEPGTQSKVRFPLQDRQIVLCEAKKNLTPEVIGQALVYSRFAAWAGAEVLETIVFAETGPPAMQKVATELGLEVVITPLTPPT